MSNPYRTLPPLGALIGFEAAARLGSFSLAAEELNLTQSAISHQIRTLETHLDQPLFLRTGRTVELTDAGRDLMQTSAEALETVRQGVHRLDAYAKPGTVVVQMPPDLAAGWFLPELARLRAELPQVEPWLYSGDLRDALEVSEFDIVCRTSPPVAPQEEGCAILPLRRAPLCPPTLRAAFEAAPETVPLIHDEHSEDWQTWYLAAGIARENTVQGLNFFDPVHAIKAAADGLGVYLGNPDLAKPWCDTGQLHPFLDITLASDQVLYMVALRRNLQRPAVRMLWDWLQVSLPLQPVSASG